jgi:uncharacterized protein (DUF608 family)
VVGPSAYCGGLWIAALAATSAMAKALQLDTEQVCATLESHSPTVCREYCGE